MCIELPFMDNEGGTANRTLCKTSSAQHSVVMNFNSVHQY